MRSSHFSLRWLSAALLLCIAGREAGAQTTWEFSPYEVEIWLVPGAAPEITPELLSDVQLRLGEHAAVAMRAAWSTKIVPAPDAALGNLSTDDITPNVDQLKEWAPDVLRLDKLFTLRLDYGEKGFTTTVRQWDGRTRRWELPIERSTAQPEMLGLTAWDAVQAAFTPAVRIEKVDGANVTARIRAGGLIVAPEENPAGFRVGDALQAVIRRNDKKGDPIKDTGVQTAPWTVLQVMERSDSLLQCQLHAAVRYSIPTRGGSRLERLAYRVTPRFPSTRLMLEARSKDKQPLEGFEVFTKPPGGETNTLLGRTDWRGALEIMPVDGPLQILFVRSGGKVVAKLPMIAGLEEQASVRLVDDHQRLHAEGLVAALQSRITDLVARREIHAARIRAKVKQEKYDEAQKLLEEMRNFETRAYLLGQLDGYQNNVKSPDRMTQKRIDKLFNDVRGLLAKFVDPQLLETLNTEIQQAQKAPPPVAPPMPQPMPETAPVPPTPETTGAAPPTPPPSPPSGS